MKSKIDNIIIDIILEHYNLLSLKGKKEILTAEEFMTIVEVAEHKYCKKIIGTKIKIIIDKFFFKNLFI